MERGGGDSRKVEIFFVSMLMDVNYLSPIWRHRVDSRRSVCVCVGGMIDIYIYDRERKIHWKRSDKVSERREIVRWIVCER